MFFIMVVDNFVPPQEHVREWSVSKRYCKQASSLGNSVFRSLTEYFVSFANYKTVTICDRLSFTSFSPFLAKAEAEETNEVKPSH